VATGKTIIHVTRGKKQHEEGHGGAWKVAYADFVTALMALFIVLWVMGQKPEVRAAIANYFQHPLGTESTEPAGAPGPIEVIALPTDAEVFKQLQKDIEQKIRSAPGFEELQKYVTLSVAKDGLRIELLEQHDSLFFQVGSADLTEPAKDLLALIAAQLARFKNTIAIEGHTDARPFGSEDPNRTNWELSAERANAARRVMEPYLNDDQLYQVVCFADKRLRIPEDPNDPANRRISILVRPREPGEEPEAVVTKPVAGGTLESEAQGWVPSESEVAPPTDEAETAPPAGEGE